jgi:tetratricopeptide (TPR) repeat protein
VKITLALAVLLLSSPAQAAFEDLGAGARAPGMGNAFTAIADDLYAIHYNPAGLAQLERAQFSASFSRFYMGLSDGSDLGTSQILYARPMKGGRWGTLGTQYSRFSLDDLYNEQTIGLSWGRVFFTKQDGRRLMLGLSAKYLTRGFKQLPEAFNAKNQLTATGSPDPVLSGETGASGMDADLGLIYRFPKRFQIGLMIRNAMGADVGFSGSDKLARDMRLGFGYKSLWMNLTGELRFEEAPDGSRDKDFVLAGERYFPTLDYGQFGARASVGFGSRQWKQMTMGLSYRINKIQTDYGFMMPIGGITGTAGTHRIALTLHFGAPTPEEEITQDLLLQAKRMREGKDAGYGYEFSDQLRPRGLDDPALKDVRMYVLQGEYRKAHRALIEIAKNLPPDEGLIRLSNRLSLTAYYYPEFNGLSEKWEVQLSSGIWSFLNAQDRKSILQGSYALSMNPNNPQLDNYLKQVEEGVGIKAERLPAGHPRTFLQELLFRVEAANNREEHDKVMRLLEDVLLLEPSNVTALERVGSTYFVLKRYNKALEVWSRAYPLETDDRERRALIRYMNEARTKLGLAPSNTPLPPAAKSQRRRPAAKRATKRTDPRSVSRLYQKGVEHYARGEYLQATAMFMRIMQIDPENTKAKRALERLKDKR